MFVKLIVPTILFALLNTITAQDLAASVIPPRPPSKQSVIKCFTCDSPSSCLQPKTTICDESAADSTYAILEKDFVDVSIARNSQFECLKLSYTLKKNVQLAVSGCINSGWNPCSLKAKNATLASASKKCNHCSKSLCNPAGTFSSSLVIVVTAMVGLLLLWKC